MMRMVFYGMLASAVLCVGRMDAATVLAVDGGDIFIDLGRRNGIQIGTIFNVYRNKEVEADFGNFKFTTRIFIGRVYAYKVADMQTVARVREMPAMVQADVEKAVLKHDIAQPAFVIPADELFKPGKDDLLAGARPKLDKMVQFLKRFEAIKIRLEAHADAQTKDADRLTRSQARGLQNYLIEDWGFDENLLVPVSYGAKKPIASNDTPAGRRTNRRFEVVIEE